MEMETAVRFGLPLTALETGLASNEVWCINVPLDPTAYRRGGQVSMAI
jgi:hypothetical protein